MWCAEAKVKLEIPLGEIKTDEIIDDWTNEQVISLIKTHRTRCIEFDEALKWLGTKDLKEALQICPVPRWRDWITTRLPRKREEVKIPVGSTITITRGNIEKYNLWCDYGIYTLSEEYVDDIVRVVCEN